MDPKMLQNRAQRAPRRSWSQVAAGSWFRNHVGLCLGPPGTPKIVLSLWRSAIFCQFCVTRTGAEIAPQMAPESNLKRPPEAPELGDALGGGIAYPEFQQFLEISKFPGNAGQKPKTTKERRDQADGGRRSLDEGVPERRMDWKDVCMRINEEGGK